MIYIKISLILGVITALNVGEGNVPVENKPFKNAEVALLALSRCYKITGQSLKTSTKKQAFKKRVTLLFEQLNNKTIAHTPKQCTKFKQETDVYSEVISRSLETCKQYFRLGTTYDHNISQSRVDLLTQLTQHTPNCLNMVVKELVDAKAFKHIQSQQRSNSFVYSAQGKTQAEQMQNSLQEWTGKQYHMINIYLNRTIESQLPKSIDHSNTLLMLLEAPERSIEGYFDWHVLVSQGSRKPLNNRVFCHSIKGVSANPINVSETLIGQMPVGGFNALPLSTQTVSKATLFF